MKGCQVSLVIRGLNWLSQDASYREMIFIHLFALRHQDFHLSNWRPSRFRAAKNVLANCLSIRLRWISNELWWVDNLLPFASNLLSVVESIFFYFHRLQLGTPYEHKWQKLNACQCLPASLCDRTYKFTIENPRIEVFFSGRPGNCNILKAEN